MQDVDAEENGVPVANVLSNDTSSEDLRSASEGAAVQASLPSSSQRLDAPRRSTGLEICSTLQFSFQDLKKRRQQRFSLLHSSNGICRMTNAKRSINY